MLQGTSTSGVSRRRPAKITSAVELLSGAPSALQLATLLQLLSVPSPVPLGAGAAADPGAIAPKTMRVEVKPAGEMGPPLAACHRWPASGPEHVETGYLADLFAR